jgi:uncharacterized DUF497 family protein
MKNHENLRDSGFPFRSAQNIGMDMATINSPTTRNTAYTPRFVIESPGFLLEGRSYKFVALKPDTR